MLVLPTNLLKNSVTIYLRIQNSHSENFIGSYQRYIKILLALKQLITGTITKKKKILIDNDIKRLNGAFQKKISLQQKCQYVGYLLHSFCSSHREVFSQYVLVALYPLGL